MRHRRLVLSFAVLASGLLGLAPSNAAPNAIIELFTSQGCSSCPAADQLAGELSRDPSLVVMSLAIDYWDYIGWKDTNAIPGHSKRQRAYSVTRGDREVYTPQVVVNGVAQAIGSDRNAIEAAITHSRKHTDAMSLPVGLAVAGDKGREVAVEAGYGTVVRQGEAPAAPVRLLEAPDLSGVAELHERPTVRIAFARLAGAVGYRIVAAEDAQMRNVVAESPLRTPTARFVDLRDGDYFYTVRGVDALGLEGREAQGRFRLRARPLPPALAMPAGGTALAPGTVEFRWEGADEAATYRFQLSADERFSTLLVDRAGLAERSLTAQLPSAGRYFWRVASERAGGEPGPFGDAESFVVREAGAGR